MDETTASDVFNNAMFMHYSFGNPVASKWKDPKLTNEKKDKIYKEFAKTSTFHQTLLNKFKDPVPGKNRKVLLKDYPNMFLTSED